MDGERTGLIYITGATGFIGSRVAQRLLERGEHVRCLVRSRARAAQLEKLGAELITGDLADAATHRQGMQAARAALHLAALYDIGIVDEQLMQRTNVAGTRAFLDAAADAETPWVVHVSTVAAFGPSPSPPDEPYDAYRGPYPSAYHRTKAESHQLARAAQKQGLPLVIVCPAFVYGPGDEGPAGRFVHDIVRRRMPALLSRPSWFSFAYVDDVANGIIAALDKGRVGEVYILSGEPASMNDFAARIASQANVRGPRLRLPVWLARGAGLMLDPIARLTGLRFPITAEAVRTSAVEPWLRSHERASRDLGYAPRSLAAGVPPTVDWALKQP